jgi:deoxyhypusine synthase
MQDREVKDIELVKGASANELVKLMDASGGFTAKKVAQGVDILEEMIKSECTNFLSFPACIIATGARGIIRDLVKEGLFQAIITTCGSVDHDIARSLAPYYHGDFNLDDIALHRDGINRLGNIVMPRDNYGKALEDKVGPILNELWREGKKDFSTRELLWEFGSRLGQDSILHWCSKKEIPIYVPGITDGAFGYQLWSFWQEHKDFKVDSFKDEDELAELVFKASKTGGLIIGGGISKHHLIWWNQFNDGLDYAVYLTTAVEYDGSLSGARAKEAISWGKVSEKARHVTIESDATAVLPLMVSALFERL